jgi:hypothetical protein
MAETSKSTTKEKAAKTKKETHKEQEKLGAASRLWLAI